MQQKSGVYIVKDQTGCGVSLENNRPNLSLYKCKYMCDLMVYQQKVGFQWAQTVLHL